MSSSSGFLLHEFMESVPLAEETPSILSGTETITEAREEPDQDRARISAGTSTRTDSREGPDADATANEFEVIPSLEQHDVSCMLGTQTQTKTREEPEQDVSSERFGVFS
jgi:hypothetical protein